MSEGPRFQIPSAQSAETPAQQIAALAPVTAALSRGGDLTGDRDAVDLLERIMLSSDEGPRRALLAQARDDATMAQGLATGLFPRVAASLESGWNDDRLSFVDVTIAATRVQDAVRALGRIDVTPKGRDAVALLVPDWEQHVLPGVLAAEALRQRGVPTRLITGLGIPAAVALTIRSGPSAILLSCGSYRSVSRMPVLITTLRRHLQRAVPIIVGGPALARDAAEMARVGADLVTSDLDQALHFCNVKLHSRNGMAEPVHAR